MSIETLTLQKEINRLSRELAELQHQFTSLRLMVVERQRIEESASVHLARACVHLTRYAGTEHEAQVVEKMYAHKSQHELDKAAKSCV